MTIPVLLGNKVRANTLVRSKELTGAFRKNVVYEFERGFLGVSKIVKSGVLVFEKIICKKRTFKAARPSSLPTGSCY